MTSNRELIEVPAPQLRDGDRDGHLMAGRRLVGQPRELADGRLELSLRWGNGRIDRAVVDPDRRLKVKRVTVGPGLPIRHRLKARTTKGQIDVIDTAHEDSPVTSAEVKGYRWALRCEHGTVVGRNTLAHACEDAADPRLWCLQCVEHVSGALLLPL